MVSRLSINELLRCPLPKTRVHLAPLICCLELLQSGLRGGVSWLSLRALAQTKRECIVAPLLSELLDSGLRRRSVVPDIVAPTHALLIQLRQRTNPQILYLLLCQKGAKDCEPKIERRSQMPNSSSYPLIPLVAFVASRSRKIYSVSLFSGARGPVGALLYSYGSGSR